ncbi:MATE family efflux transporter [Jeotgalibaca sp. MA1X17-3]|uniref:MATE family efflux transporter n=1 Tax=Jeotgalibaca sp. MA1X17-3 TaxID=2908211 RepID=UPI001F1E7E59|nr:MATE family efflux transporter [Jeotgalibaca sp. MA1X17-3]UJF16381.1 MATE family efflux transporter [Jeotgalibaca sp. MA1X17-3]
MGQDMTKGNPLQLIIQFTIPMLLGNIFQQFYSMADTYIVSQTLGVEAFTAVGATGSITFLILGLAAGLTAGLSVVTAQYFGKKDHQGLRRSLAAGTIISAVVALLLTIFATRYTREILVFMKTPASLIDNAHAYLSVVFSGTAASVFYNLLSNMMRAIGDSKTPLLFLAVASVVNIILDYVFILVFHTGVEGAGYATVFSQMIATIFCLIYIYKKIPILRIHKEDWKLTRKEIAHHLQIGLPMGFQSSIIAIGTMSIQVTLNGLGATAVAATTAAEKINGIATMPLQSFGITMATYTAQNFGAGKLDRIWDGVQKITRVVLIYSFVMGTVLIFFGRKFATIFVGSENQAILDHVETYFLTNATFYFLLAMLFIYRYTLQGLGKSTAPTAAGIMELLSRIIAAIVLSQSFGYLGVSLAGPLAWLGALIPLMGSYYLTKRALTKDIPTQTVDEKKPFFPYPLHSLSKLLPKFAK